MSTQQTSDAEQVIAEHAIQLRLLDSLHDAIEEQKGRDAVQAIFDQLLDYSKIHFLSEELLMRLHSYEGYRDHLRDHEQMVEEMQTLRAQHANETQPLTWDVVEHLRSRILRHITHRDRELHEHVSANERAARTD